MGSSIPLLTCDTDYMKKAHNDMSYLRLENLKNGASFLVQLKKNNSVDIKV